MRIILLTTLLWVSQAHCYFSTMDTGEIIKSGQYRAMADLQYVGDPSGLNLGGAFDAGVSESSNIRALAGFGSVSFTAGLMYKWVPFPDYQNQPAIGIMAGGVWARYEGENYPSLRIHPIVSKDFEIDIGKLTPYASLPFGVTSGPRRNTFPLQLALGSQIKLLDFPDWAFLAEVGLNLNESFSYGTVGAAYYFDEK